jgi:hypothetical protein
MTREPDYIRQGIEGLPTMADRKTREQEIQERLDKGNHSIPLDGYYDATDIQAYDQDAIKDDITYLLARVKELEGMISLTIPCTKCQGNGEIVTDWERYKHQLPGDTGDEAVADCPDCDGTGRISEEATNAQRDARLVRAHGALKLALEYWAHRQQRYKNRHPVWVEAARAALATDDAAIAKKIGEVG